MRRAVTETLRQQSATTLIISCEPRLYRLFHSTTTLHSSKATAPQGVLSTKASQRQEQKKDYQRDGFLVVKDVFTPQEVRALQEESIALVRGKYGPFENMLQAQGQLRDQEVQAQYTHFDFPHKLSPRIKELAICHPKIVEVLMSIIGPHVKCMHSRYYLEGPGRRARVWHQEEMSIPTRDRSLVCAFIALHPHTLKNGCLWTVAGSHRSGVLYRTKEPSSSSESEAGLMGDENDPSPSTSSSSSTNLSHPTSSSPNSSTLSSTGYSPTSTSLGSMTSESSVVGTEGELPYNHIYCSSGDDPTPADLLDPDVEPAGVPIELTPGSVAFVHGYTLQRLATNPGEGLPLPSSLDANKDSLYPLRSALKIMYCSAQTWLPWSPNPKIPLTSDLRDIIPVCGTDPYFYKGTVDVNRPKAFHSSLGRRAALNVLMNTMPKPGSANDGKTNSDL